MKIFAILNNHTNEFCAFNGNIAWTKEGNAKRSFNLSRPMLDNKKFDDYEQSGVYSVVELTENYFRLKGLDK